ncbi:hypothetical protein [Actinomycetospora endophytica]|uniref:hypothetical protein n=1 Tax=Actinomycetospora endophytica TaxID=2291215 RepID=UPI003555E58C
MERFHQTLRRELLDHVAPFADLDTAQAAIDAWYRAVITSARVRAWTWPPRPACSAPDRRPRPVRGVPAPPVGRQRWNVLIQPVPGGGLGPDALMQRVWTQCPVGLPHLDDH